MVFVLVVVYLVNPTNQPQEKKREAQASPDYYNNQLFLPPLLLSPSSTSFSPLKK
jgi:hypothetical protein